MILKTIPFLLIVLYSFSAQAHTRWSYPTARVDKGPPFGGVKMGPCGGGAHGDQGVVEFTAGEQVTVQLEETVHHAGVYQVLFGTSENELWDQNTLFVAADNPNHTQLGNDIPDPPGVDGVFDVTIQIPNEPCDKCILQGLQWMSGSSTYYFSCADIRIVAPTTTGADTGSPDMSADLGHGPDLSSSDVGAPNDQDGGSLPILPDTGSKSDAGKDSTQAEGGCSQAAAPFGESPLSLLFFIALGWVGIRRRKRRT